MLDYIIEKVFGKLPDNIVSRLEEARKYCSVPHSLEIVKDFVIERYYLNNSIPRGIREYVDLHKEIKCSDLYSNLNRFYYC